MFSRKSTMIVTVFIAFMYLVFVPIVYAAKEYKMADYWPFKEGSWWEFNDGKIEITGSEEIDGINTFKYVDTGSCTEGKEFNGVNDDTNGFGFFLYYKDGSYSLVKMIEPYVKKGDKTTASLKDDEGEVTLVFKLEGTADVVVPAGKFKRCLRFSVKAEVVDTDGNYSYYIQKFYLAKGVGLVKAVRVEESAGENGCVFAPESFDVFNGIRKLKDYSQAATSTSTPTPTPTPSGPVLATINSNLFYTEHALFIIPEPGQVNWADTNTWDSVYLKANTDSYVSTLKAHFPSDYFFVVIAANKLIPDKVPRVAGGRHMADGIGIYYTGVGVPNICKYNIGGGAVPDGAFGVLDHEIGHNWGVHVGLEVCDTGGHWLENSTVLGQMALTYSDDEATTVKQIAGDPTNGFYWTAVNNLTRNETETFSDQDLYLQGFNDSFPDLYVINSPVYNDDHTVSYSSATKYGQAWVEARNGVRSPNYQASEKKLRMGFVYVARDQSEVLEVYQNIERSASQFVNAEAVDTVNFRYQVPFLVETHFRASVDALLTDLDGNATPTLSISGPAYLVSSDGSALVPFLAFDSDGPTPVVSCVPSSVNCSISGANATLSGLTTGVHFFTIKAQDGGGKKTFAHFVIKVP